MGNCRMAAAFSAEYLGSPLTFEDREGCELGTEYPGGQHSRGCGDQERSFGGGAELRRLYQVEPVVDLQDCDDDGEKKHA